MNITDLPSSVQAKINTDCWVWSGAKSSKGYGCLWSGGKSHLAHRFVYELMIEPLTPGAQVDHKCRNILCVNPDHLEPVTHAENMRRVSEAYKVCKAGHAMTEENTIVKQRAEGRVSRECRACSVEASRRFRERRKGAPVAKRAPRKDLSAFFAEEAS